MTEKGDNMEWYEVKEFSLAYSDLFESCVRDTGFLWDKFEEKLCDLINKHFLQSKDAFNEMVSQILSDADYEYAEMRKDGKLLEKKA
jgi:hypothetical protein